jgi:phage N-6-adenine-methyltransferase
VKGQDQLFSSKSDEGTTPRWLFDQLNKKFAFQCDVAASDSNHLCERYFTIENSALGKEWEDRNFCNPPYSNIKDFALSASLQGAEGKLTVMLVPARTDTEWFHKYIKGDWHFELLKGRLKFGDSKNSAPFPSMLVYFGISA